MFQAQRAPFEKFDGSGLWLAIVVAQFNPDITGQLLEQALQTLKIFGVKPENIKVFNVSGCIEVPLVLDQLAECKKYDALIALGAVIRGETSHFDYVCKIVSEGVLRVMLDHQIPVGFGILTVNNREQAQARISAGAGAAEAAVRSVKIIQSIR